MECCKAEELFMRFLDNNLTQEEASNLREHTSKCSHCNEEFETYKLIAIGFKEIDLVPTPIDFEAKVMKQIEAIDIYSEHCNFDYICGLSFVITGFCSILFLLFEPKFEFFNIVHSIGFLANDLFLNIRTTFISSASTTLKYLSSASIWIFFILSGLSLTTAITFRKSAS